MSTNCTSIKSFSQVCNWWRWEPNVAQGPSCGSVLLNLCQTAVLALWLHHFHQIWLCQVGEWGINCVCLYFIWESEGKRDKASFPPSVSFCLGCHGNVPATLRMSFHFKSSDQKIHTRVRILVDWPFSLFQIKSVTPNMIKGHAGCCFIWTYIFTSLRVTHRIRIPQSIVNI